jgi:MoaA/NifB/PqqE/SkfB family radical SAM enzyme
MPFCMRPFLEDKKTNLRRALQAMERNGRAAELESKPLLLHLEITTRCNLRCIKCGHYNDAPGSPRIAPRHLQYAILDTFDGEFLSAAARVHTFGYGEMFLYGRLQDLVRKLKQHGCMVDGITNGVLVGEKEVDWLVEYGFDEITFSIDGVEPETMLRLRGVEVERIWRTLEYLKRRKRESGAACPRLIVNFVAQADNYLELPALARRLADLDVYFLGVNTLVDAERADPPSDTYTAHYREFALRNAPRASVQAALEEARGVAAAAGFSFATYIDLEAEYAEQPGGRLVQIVARQPGEEPRGEGKLAPYYCLYPWMSVYLHADTTARVCCYMNGDIGAVASGEDLGRVWNGPKLAEIRDAVSRGEVHPQCRGCVRAGRYQHSAADLADIRNVLGEV